jgi:NAD+ diphosphatase
VSFIISPTPATQTAHLWFIWDGPQLLYINGELPKSALGLRISNPRAVATVHGTLCQSAELIGQAPANSEWRGMRQALLDMDPALQQALSRARQLHLFQREHRFCGACASPLLANAHDSGKRCPSCDALYYPRLSPAMMVSIVRGREILLARAPHFSEGMYSALAGFVEPGETLEQCVHREVMEEVGVRVGQLHYVASQSWPFPHSLMLAFVAEYIEGDIVPQEGEIEDARWFNIDQLPTLPTQASIAWRLIQYTIAQINDQAAAN